MPDISQQPAPVTEERILAALERMNISTLSDGEDGIAISFFPHLFFIPVGQGLPLVGVCSFHRVFDVQFSSQIAPVVAAMNSEFYAPKLYSVVSDDGKIQLRLTHCFNWDMGATDAQIGAELDAFFGGALQLLSQIEAAFPDPWNALEQED